MNKKQLIRYIKANDPFYEFADLNAHSQEQLEAIVSSIKKKRMRLKNK